MSIEYNHPDIAGPAMIAPVHVALNRATTRGNAPSGATICGNARIDGLVNALHTPNAIAIAKNGHTAVGSLSEYSNRPSAHASSPVSPRPAIFFRLKRSASEPVSNTNTGAGANSARPSHAKSIERPVMSKICFPSTAACSATPSEISVYEPSKIRTSRSASTSRPEGTEVGAEVSFTE